jgi:hypothetical protein
MDLRAQGGEGRYTYKVRRESCKGKEIHIAAKTSVEYS